MKIGFALLLFACLIFAQACSKPARFLLLNASGVDIAVELPHQNTTIANGHFVELGFSPVMVVSCKGERRAYPWTYPLPVTDYMEFGKPTERFALSLEADGKIYARKIANGRPSDTIPPQPAGFPLTPQIK